MRSNYYHSKSVANTEETAFVLAQSLQNLDKCFLALFGDVGAGKTTFVRGFCRAFGYTGHVTSPTYTLCNEYPAKKNIYHFDMYRIDEKALESIGFFDCLGENAFIICEWCENIKNSIPNNAVKIYIDKKNDDERLIKINIPD